MCTSKSHDIHKSKAEERKKLGFQCKTDLHEYQKFVDEDWLDSPPRQALSWG